MRDKFSRIETERLILREWTLADISDTVEGLNNYDVTKYLPLIPFPYTEKDAEQFICNIEKPNNAKNLNFAVELKVTKKVIGGTSIRIDENGNAEGGGIWINPKYQGKGYGSEIWKARARFCFDVLKAKEIINGFLSDNEISWKMQKKLGYKLRGDTKEVYCLARKCNVIDIKTILKKEDFIEE